MIWMIETRHEKLVTLGTQYGPWGQPEIVMFKRAPDIGSVASRGSMPHEMDESLVRFDTGMALPAAFVVCFGIPDLGKLAYSIINLQIHALLRLCIMVQKGESDPSTKKYE